MKLVLATRNPKKISEMKALLAGVPVTLLSLADFPNVPEIAETGTTFEENAELKAREVAVRTGMLALADDSGLEVDALGGEPGVYTNRFAGPGASDREKYTKILDLMKDIPHGKRTARFKAAIAIVSPDGRTSVVVGVCEGIIAREPRGECGFGYDPIFYLPELRKTMAELTPEKKNRISHRGKALRAAKEILYNLIN